MGCITLDEKANLAEIDENECVECGVCFRSEVCAVNAMVEEVHPWPRSVRAVFSNPLLVHKETRVPGRGTEEVKTNEVTGHFRRGFVGITVEMGRPGIGARFYDVEKMAQALARAGVEFAANNPVTYLMTDRATGKLKEEILNEKVCSAMIESTTPIDNLAPVIRELKESLQRIDTVFSLTLSTRLDEDGAAPCETVLKNIGVPFYINGKTNVALGRPFYKEV
jgi:hypothetical protein